MIRIRTEAGRRIREEDKRFRADEAGRIDGRSLDVSSGLLPGPEEGERGRSESRLPETGSEREERKKTVLFMKKPDAGKASARK